MADFATAYAPLAGFEGGWCNVQGDSGGETYAGIARRYWPDWPGWKLIDGEKDHSCMQRTTQLVPLGSDSACLCMHRIRRSIEEALAAGRSGADDGDGPHARDGR